MKFKHPILTLLVLLILMCSGLACQKYNQTLINLEEFKKNYDEVAPPIPPPTRPKKKKKPIDLKGRRFAPPPYQSMPSESSPKAEEQLEPTPPKPIEEPRKPVTFWAKKVLDWAQEYKEIGTQARDIRLNNIAEKYSHRAWDLSKHASKIQDLSFEESSLRVQAWLAAEKIPELPEKPKYFAGQDAFEEIAKAMRAYEKFDDKLCAVIEGVQLPPSLGYMEYAIDLLKDKNYSRARIAAQKAYYYVAARDPAKLECNDLDADKVPEPLDECPVNPEDRDQFEDDDGCPDEDNDQDGILDKDDLCPLDPEVVNQFQDDDGCPDNVESIIGVFITAEEDLIHPEYFFDTLRQVQDTQDPKLRYTIIVSSNGVIEEEKEKLEIIRLQNLRNAFRILQQEFTIPLQWMTRSSYERERKRLPNGQVLILGSNPRWKKR